MSAYYKVTEIRPHVYRMFSGEQVHMDLFVGERAALLFDTGYGYGNLKETVRKITDLPLTVVNSHGHLDHACGNYQFTEEIYIHPDDMELCRGSNARDNRLRSIEHAKHTADYATGEEHNILPEGFDEEAYAAGGCGNLVPVTGGHVFDLGGITLRVVELPGHTKGSIGLLYEEERMLYAGDALNGFLWLFLPESLDLATYTATIKKAQGIGFDWLVMSHNPVIAKKAVLDDFLDCATHVDYEHGIPYEGPIPGISAKVCMRPGYRGMEDMAKPGFASIVISEEHL